MSLTQFPGPAGGTAATTASAYITQQDYDANGNMTYYGLAVPGTATSAAAWQIRKLTYSATGNLLKTEYAGGVGTFSNVWDNHLALAYS